jgi:hypothetical protein
VSTVENLEVKMIMKFRAVLDVSWLSAPWSGRIHVTSIVTPLAKITMTHVNILTPWSKVFLEEPIATSLVKKYPRPRHL